MTAIGIDDWAFRKGVNYGTIIVDLATGKVIDLIQSRDEEDVKQWLEMHPHVELITKDRYAVYRNAATKALPSVKLVADRFHLLKNLTDKVYEIIQLSYKDILKLTACQTSTNNLLPENIPISNPMLMAALRIQRSFPSSELHEVFRQVKELHQNGISIRSIAEMLSLHRQTVKRYLSVEELTNNRGQITNNYAPPWIEYNTVILMRNALKLYFLRSRRWDLKAA